MTVCRHRYIRPIQGFSSGMPSVGCTRKMLLAKAPTVVIPQKRDAIPNRRVERLALLAWAIHSRREQIKQVVARAELATSSNR